MKHDDDDSFLNVAKWIVVWSIFFYILFKGLDSIVEYILVKLMSS